MGLHDGHRARIRERLSQGAVLDHEILEILLFNALPRQNTNDLAHRLLAEFGTIARIFSASMEELQQVKGMGKSLASYIYCVGLCYDQYYANRIKAQVRPREYKTDEFLSYVKESYEYAKREVVDLYALDENRNIIGSKRFSQDSLFKASLPPEEISLFLSENRACGLVIVHNHPLGKPEPSPVDEETTRKCQLICSLQNILFCDHVIYSPTGIYSYYREGKLQEIAQRYSAKNVLSEVLAKEKA